MDGGPGRLFLTTRGTIPQCGFQGCVPTHHILDACYGFEVQRVHAALISTEMVDLFPDWNRSDEMLV